LFCESIAFAISKRFLKLSFTALSFASCSCMKAAANDFHVHRNPFPDLTQMVS
jgi:hypothetical protein